MVVKVSTFSEKKIIILSEQEYMIKERQRGRRRVSLGIREGGPENVQTLTSDFSKQSADALQITTFFTIFCILFFFPGLAREYHSFESSLFSERD